MRILIGCECSGRVRDAFRAKGHDAVSCDLKESETPGPHLQCSVLDVLGDGWDMAVFHPECRFLCFSGERWIREKPGRAAFRDDAFLFFKQLAAAPIPKIVIENSHSVFLNTNYKKPTQTVHPYHFGDPFKKSICLWLKGVPPLVPDNILPIGKRYPAAWMASGMGKGETRSANRARTYPGIARAMAEQWG